MEIELRNDDVLQTHAASVHQGYRTREKSLYDWFMWADEIFEKYNFPCTLAILGEGIEHAKTNVLYQKWVEHIKKNKHRYTIELHGFHHRHPNELTREEMFKDISEGKKIVEDTFETKITTWYIPFGRRYQSPFGKEICEELGLNYDKYLGNIGTDHWLKSYQKHKVSPYEQINFHYWHKEQVQNVEEIIKIWHQTQENN